MMEQCLKELPKDVICELVNYKLVINGGNNFSLRLADTDTLLNRLDVDIRPTQKEGIEAVYNVLSKVEPATYNRDYKNMIPFSENLALTLINQFIEITDPGRSNSTIGVQSPGYYETNFIDNWLLTPVCVSYLGSYISVTPYIHTWQREGIQVTLNTPLATSLWDKPILSGDLDAPQTWFHSGY